MPHQLSPRGTRSSLWAEAPALRQLSRGWHLSGAASATGAFWEWALRSAGKHRPREPPEAQRETPLGTPENPEPFLQACLLL